VDALSGDFCAFLVCLHLALVEAGASHPAALRVDAGLVGLVAPDASDLAADRLFCGLVLPQLAKWQAARTCMRCMRTGFLSWWAFQACSMF
jgi:hypothetical protein